jgi:hypothetical protein
MSRWEAERRLDFIEDHMLVEGSISRGTICEYFGISLSQASSDLGRYGTLNKALVYDVQAKHYRWKDKARAVRGSTPARRAVWTLFV